MSVSINEILKEFKEKVYEDKTFILNNTRFYIIKEDNISYIYGSSIHNEHFESIENSYCCKKIILCAFEVEDKIYIVNECLLKIYDYNTDDIPENIYFLKEIIEEINDYKETIISDYIKDLDIFGYGYCDNEEEIDTYTPGEKEREISADDMKDYFIRARSKARYILPRNDEFFKATTDIKIEEKDIFKTICNKDNLKEYVYNKTITGLKNQKNYLKKEITYDYIVEKYLNNPDKLYTKMELNILNSVKDLKSKTINVEFNNKGKSITDKMELDSFKRSFEYAYRFDNIRGFSSYKKAREIEDILDVKEIELKYISKITYNNKILYKKAE